MMIQVSLLTPPVGLNVYVLKGCVPDEKLTDIFKYALPWVGVQLAVVALVLIVPGMTTWIPSLMK